MKKPMMRKTRYRAAAAGLFFVTVAVPPFAVAKDEAFTQEELTDFLAGKSYSLGGGGKSGAFFFHADGTLEAIWKGKTETSTWTAEEDSKFCYSLKMFGGRECIQLLKRGGDKLVHVYGGEKRILNRSDVVEGKSF